MLQQPYRLYDYHVWANERLFAHLETLPEEAFHGQVSSVFSSLSQTFAHMYKFEQLFMSVLAGVPNDEIFPKLQGWTDEAQNAGLDELHRLFAGLTEQFRDLLRRTPDPDKAMKIEHPHYGLLDTSFSEILRHVVNHGTYHRGNIAAMLRQQGYAGVPTDYIFYLAEQQQGYGQ